MQIISPAGILIFSNHGYCKFLFAAAFLFRLQTFNRFMHNFSAAAMKTKITERNQTFFVLDIKSVFLLRGIF